MKFLCLHLLLCVPCSLGLCEYCLKQSVVHNRPSSTEQWIFWVCREARFEFTWVQWYFYLDEGRSFSGHLFFHPKTQVHELLVLFVHCRLSRITVYLLGQIAVGFLEEKPANSIEGAGKVSLLKSPPQSEPCLQLRKGRLIFGRIWYKHEPSNAHDTVLTRILCDIKWGSELHK